jgi:hypothetical protein
MEVLQRMKQQVALLPSDVPATDASAPLNCRYVHEKSRLFSTLNFEFTVSLTVSAGF